MSSIHKLDTKDTNSTELLDVLEGPELIDVSDIQLDKTNLETYMNDFNKNFYKIKFSKKLLTDYYELYTLENYGINTKDIRNETFVDEEENKTTKDNKQIKATPIGFPGLISSKNHSSNVITSNLVKSSINNSIEKTFKDATPEPTPCVGLTYSANLASSFSDYNQKWTIKTGNLKIPIDLNVSIPSFRIASPVINLKELGVKIGYSSDCDEERNRLLYSGDTWPCRNEKFYSVTKCNKDPVFKSKWCSTSWRSKTADQIYFMDHNYSPKELMIFNGLGVKFNAVIDTSFVLQFQLVTNIPVGRMLLVLKEVDNLMYEKVKNKTNVNEIITTLTENIDFASILKIMKEIVVRLVAIQINSGVYIEFYITHIGINLNFIVNQISLNYGANSYSPTGSSSFNTSFNLLASDQYISFSLNPASLEITAEFVLYEQPLHKLLRDLSSPTTKQYLSEKVDNTGITGGALAAIIIARENIKKNSDEIYDLLTGPPRGRTNAEINVKMKNLGDKNTILNSTIDGILNTYKGFKTIHYGDSSKPISKIIDKFNPTIKISMMLCTAGLVAAFVSCVSITLPNTNIINFVKDSVKTIIEALPTLKFADKIPSKFISAGSLFLTTSEKNKVRAFNNEVDKTNDILNNGILIALNDVLNMLQNQMSVSPSLQFCVPYAVV